MFSLPGTSEYFILLDESTTASSAGFGYIFGAIAAIAAAYYSIVISAKVTGVNVSENI
ncbi:hypothetical protein [Nostoc sp. 'Peltigera malacea cyanobiont' DB3992]|uniref:hypothetical protein n=1 Tax=Nostoc sp. 'Peltigera malacea cyanobiont' DB3992 TaxID=1206980 RepID=UPI00211E925C|nr:hypothetical protein [Nostoc sp. 'Peltigera malacea cyanobiont' DB3992]